MKNQKTLISYLFKPLRFKYNKSTKPFVLNVPLSQKKLKIKTGNIEDFLKNNLALNIQLSGFKNKIKISKNTNVEMMDMKVVLKEQSSLFSQLLIEKHEEIKKEILRKYKENNNERK